MKWKHWDMCTMCTLYNVIQRKADSIANYNTISIQYIALHDGNIPYFSAMQSVWNWQKCFIVIINRFGRHMAKNQTQPPVAVTAVVRSSNNSNENWNWITTTQPLMMMQMAPLLWSFFEDDDRYFKNHDDRHCKGSHHGPFLLFFYGLWPPSPLVL